MIQQSFTENVLYYEDIIEILRQYILAESLDNCPMHSCRRSFQP